LLCLPITSVALPINRERILPGLGYSSQDTFSSDLQSICFFIIMLLMFQNQWVWRLKVLALYDCMVACRSEIPYIYSMQGYTWRQDERRYIIK
jgi:hypothetical protein